MKRFFISFFVVLLAAGLLYWGTALLSGYVLAYLGGLISASVGLTYFIGSGKFLKIKSPFDITKVFSVLIYGGLLCVLTSLYGNPVPEHYFALAYTALILVMWEKYFSWYSVIGGRALLFNVDEKLPEGKLYRAGQEISLDAISNPTVWLLYRGNWSSYCKLQLEDYSLNSTSFKDLGYAVKLISTQPEKQSEQLAGKLDKSLEIYQDPNGEFIESLGLLEKGGLPLGLEWFGYDTDIAYPAIIATDKHGMVCYYDITDNYRERPLSKVLLDELNALKK